MIKKLIAKIINWACADEIVTVGSIKVMHPKTTYTDTIQEKTVGAGVTVTALRPNNGLESALPLDINSQPCQLYYATDTLRLFIHIGIGQPGANAEGWYNLKNALYAA